MTNLVTLGVQSVVRRKEAITRSALWPTDGVEESQIFVRQGNVVATFQLRRFCNRETLRSIAYDRLFEFLAPYQDFFAERQLRIPTLDNAREFDFDALIKIFLSPDGRTPVALMDALFLVDEMSTVEAMDSLIDAVPDLVHELGSHPSPADIAVHVWLTRPDIIERKHAEQFVFRPRSFHYYLPQEGKPNLQTCHLDQAIQGAENELDVWFERKKRGRNCRIFFFDHPNQAWFLIRHGEPYRREEALADGAVQSVCYRPLKYDVAVFDPHSGDLRVNANLVGEREQYCVVIGRHFFGNPGAFLGSRAKYTLDPIRVHRQAGLTTSDIEELEWATVAELQLTWSGSPRLIQTLQSFDVLGALEDHRRKLNDEAKITKATFRIKFLDSPTPRLVTIIPPTRANYARDSDAEVIERWLMRRGFIELPPDQVPYFDSDIVNSLF